MKIRGKREERREKVEIRSEFRIIENGKRVFVELFENCREMYFYNPSVTYGASSLYTREP